MKNKKVYLVLFLAIALLLTACTNKDEGDIVDEVDDQEEGMLIVTDTLGREVQIPKDAKEFINVGAGALRLYTYVAPIDKVIGVEESEKSGLEGVPYSIINREYLTDLPVIGQGGPGSSLNPEQIIEVDPDVVFSTYTTDSSEIDDLQSQIGIPVIALSYGETGDIFGDDLKDSVKLIGQVTGEDKRAEELINILDDYQNDLDERTKNIPEDEKPTVYVGALGHQGPNGIESTRGNYPLLNILNSKNVVDESNADGPVMLDKEQIVEWDPEYIFVDMDGYHIVKEDYEDKPEFYENLTAVQEGKVYSQLPYILSRTNFETAIADAYYIGTVLYPEEFKDINPEEKADEVYVNFLGEPFYEIISKNYRPFGPLTIGE